MALEPITRQEKIIAGQDLTPITRMEIFLKQFGGGGGSGGSGGGVTTLHINVTGINTETKEPIFTADKTPMEMLRASTNGPIWCVISFAAGIMGEEAVSFGVPPTWGAGTPTFGTSVGIRHREDGNNDISDVVTSELPNTWILDLGAFGG